MLRRAAFCFAALASLAAAAGAQTTKDGGLYAPSIFDLRIGAHARELPRDEFINYAIGPPP